MLAIIGGTGIYELKGVDSIQTLSIETPFGQPSAPIVKARYKDKPFLFLPRHGRHHQFLPHEINYRANIFALKQLGARQVLSVSAAGSLREAIHPGDFVIPDQYFDFRRASKRANTFFGEGIAAHIATAEPVCPHMTRWVRQKAGALGITLLTGKTYACVNGPRLGTRAESCFLRMAGCDIVGMTNVPEVFLAREAQLCYVTVAIVTDYDCWMEDPNDQVSVSAVVSRYGQCLETVQTLLLALLDTPLPPIDTTYREALKEAVLTPEEAIPVDKRAWLNVLRR